MADNDDKKKPWGDALAPFERDAKTIWIDLGPVWQGDNGSLQFTLVSEPLHWRAHAAERRIVITKRADGPAPSSTPSNTNTGRRGAR
jgi:hypothetical protein